MRRGESSEAIDVIEALGEATNGASLSRSFGLANSDDSEGRVRAGETGVVDLELTE